MKSNNSLLHRLLQLIVDEWGYEEVLAGLAKTSSSLENHVGEGAVDGRARSVGKVKPTAMDQIERASIEMEQKQVLLPLAERYDRKQFLPTVADVREFLIMMGEPPHGMKDRRDAFRVLLRSLVLLPVERLQEIADSELHSGPSELGPLSDAIAAAGARLPRHGQMSSN